MPDKTKSRDESVDDSKAEVNPAARRDRPGQLPFSDERREEDNQVPPVQEEPLDPLGPGGIGA
jgi:hypothetical protein